MLSTLGLVSELVERAKNEREAVIPAYTHRQRAQPVSIAFLLCAWAHMLLRSAKLQAFAMHSANECPLGSGACSGSSLPIDRTITTRLLGFARPTANALDSVGDRDFALDWTWAAARTHLALSRLCTDMIDFSTSEFGFIKLDSEIAAGSSMMPQKKNPDVFELVRGQTGSAIGNVMSLLVLVKGLPTGYNRDLQEDRCALMSTGPRLLGALRATRLALPRVAFDHEATEKALFAGFTQATDLAEALVREGMAFREAYKSVGQLVAKAVDSGTTLVAVADADPTLTDAARAVLAPRKAAAAKESIGGTGTESVDRQISELETAVSALQSAAHLVPTLASIAQTIAGEPFSK
jgi:argininosuccinate lyase